MIRIRILKPAAYFYDCLMEIWILFKTKNVFSQVNFTSDFLPRAKEQIGEHWNDKYFFKLVITNQRLFFSSRCNFSGISLIILKMLKYLYRDH